MNTSEREVGGKCLISGASGSNGRELARLFSQRGLPVRALVRDLSRAEAIRLPGVELVEGDFDRPETLPGALEGIERAFLLSPSSERAEQQQLGFVQAARESGVRHIVKLSQIHARPGSPVRFLRYHARVEAAIRDSGLAWTFLRPNLFMQGLLAFAPAIKERGAFFAPIGEARVSLVDVRDIAACALAALTEPGHEGKIYNLTGPRALSHGEIAAILSGATGRTIRFVDVPPDAMRQALLEMKMPAWQAEGLIEDYAHYSRGEAQDVAPGVQDATGQAPRSFESFAHEHAGQFR